MDCFGNIITILGGLKHFPQIKCTLFNPTMTITLIITIPIYPQCRIVCLMSMPYLQSDIFIQSNKTISESIEACRKPPGVGNKDICKCH